MTVLFLPFPMTIRTEFIIELKLILKESSKNFIIFLL